MARLDQTADTRQTFFSVFFFVFRVFDFFMFSFFRVLIFPIFCVCVFIFSIFCSFSFCEPTRQHATPNPTPRASGVIIMPGLPQDANA